MANGFTFSPPQRSQRERCPHPGSAKLLTQNSCRIFCSAHKSNTEFLSALDSSTKNALIWEQKLLKSGQIMFRDEPDGREITKTLRSRALLSHHLLVLHYPHGVTNCLVTNPCRRLPSSTLLNLLHPMHERASPLGHKA